MSLATPTSQMQDARLSKGNVSPFLAALTEASDVLSLQRSALALLGQAPATPPATQDMQPLSTDPQACSDEQRIRLLHATLAEIHRRQKQISANLAAPHDNFEAIALDAFSNAMHRIRTCLDIALGCAEEVGEICRSGEETGEAASVAQEAARALRLVYHYTHELNDMAALNTLIREGTPSPVEGNLALGEAAEGLARPAADASVNLIFEPSSEPLAILAEPALLVRALRYLILMAVVSPGVTSVACSVRAIRTTDGDMVEFLINDDGRGTTLEKRASLTPGADGLFSGAEGKPAADAAGFAIARRLAKAFGGHVSLEVAPGRGSKVALVAPRFVGAA